MENKLFDKLVLYDFIGVLFTGVTVISLTYILIFWGILNDFNIDGSITLSGTLLYVVCSYLVGTVLHEASILFLKKTVHKKGKPSQIYMKKDITGFHECDRKMLKGALEIHIDEHKKYFEKAKIFDEEDSYQIYDYCKLVLRKAGMYSYVETMQSLYVLSRSLFAYCLFSSFLFPISVKISSSIVQNISYTNIVVCELGLIILTLVFYSRTKKLADIVVTRTIKSFSVYVITGK